MIKRVINLFAFFVLSMSLLFIGCDSSSSDFEPYTPAAAPPPPSVVSTTPANGSTDVPINTNLTITFTKPIDTSALTESIIDLNGIEFEITFTDTTITVDPSVDLLYNTDYTIPIKSEWVVDVTGIAMESDYTWRFSTQPVPDELRPKIVSTEPDDGDIDVAIDSSIAVVFDRPMDTTVLESLIDNGKIDLGEGIEAEIIYTDREFTAIPSITFNYGQTYVISIPKEITDKNGYQMIENHTWSFITEPAPEAPPDFGKIIDMTAGSDSDIVYAISENQAGFAINVTSPPSVNEFAYSPFKPSAFSYCKKDDRLYTTGSAKYFTYYNIQNPSSNLFKVSYLSAIEYINLGYWARGLDIATSPSDNRIFVLFRHLDLFTPQNYLSIIDMEAIGNIWQVDLLAKEPIEGSKIALDEIRKIIFTSKHDQDSSTVTIFKYSVAEDTLNKLLEESVPSCNGEIEISSDGTRIVLPCGNNILDFDTDLNEKGYWALNGNINYVKFDPKPDGTALYASSDAGQFFIIENITQPGYNNNIQNFNYPNSQFHAIFTPNSDDTAVIGYSYNSSNDSEHELVVFPGDG